MKTDDQQTVIANFNCELLGDYHIEGLQEAIINGNIFSVLDVWNSHFNIQRWNTTFLENPIFKNLRDFVCALFRTSEPEAALLLRKIRKHVDPFFLPGTIEVPNEYHLNPKTETTYSQDIRPLPIQKSQLKIPIPVNVSGVDQQKLHTDRLAEKLHILQSYKNSDTPMLQICNEEKAYRNEYRANVGNFQARRALVEGPPQKWHLNEDEPGIIIDDKETQWIPNAIPNYLIFLAKKQGTSTGTRYMNQNEREVYRVWPVHNLLTIMRKKHTEAKSRKPPCIALLKANTEAINPLDTKQGDMVIMTLRGEIYSIPKQHFCLHHSSLANGLPLLFAGFWKVDQGRLLKVYAHSGHYRPKQENLETFLAVLYKYGIDLTQTSCYIKDDKIDKQYLPTLQLIRNKSQLIRISDDNYLRSLSKDITANLRK